MVGDTDRSRADFRALRERVGLTVANLAADLGVSESAARRWDTTDGYRPPSEAWALLDRYADAQEHAVEHACEAAASGAPSPVPIMYYRSQAEYATQGGDGHVGVANATSRAVGAELERRGFRTRYHFPDEKTRIS